MIKFKPPVITQELNLHHMRLTNEGVKVSFFLLKIIEKRAASLPNFEEKIINYYNNIHAQKINWLKSSPGQ